jgi:hypothetical protein
MCSEVRSTKVRRKTVNPTDHAALSCPQLRIYQLQHVRRQALPLKTHGTPHELRRCNEGRHAMTTMGKTLFVVLSLGALFGATLALRTEHTPANAAQLTTAQMAEVQPAPKPAHPPKATPMRATDPEDDAPPDLDLEDGSGS